MSGSGVALRKRLFNKRTQARPWTQHRPQLTSSDTLQITFKHFLLNYHSDAQLWRDFCRPRSCEVFFVLPRQNLFPPPLSLCYFLQLLSPSVSHSLHLSLQTHSPSVRFLQLVHISSPISCTPLPLCTPVSPSFPLFCLLSTSACCHGGSSKKKGEYVDSHSFI